MIGIFVDTETTGLPNLAIPFDAPLSKQKVMPVQIAWSMIDMDTMKSVEPPRQVYIKLPDLYHWDAFDRAFQIHQIPWGYGTYAIEDAMQIFASDYTKAQCVLAYNLPFDMKILNYASGGDNYPGAVPGVCVMRLYAKTMGYSRNVKLSEAYKETHGGKSFEGAHDGSKDVAATIAVYKEICAKLRNKATNET